MLVSVASSLLLAFAAAASDASFDAKAHLGSTSPYRKLAPHPLPATIPDGCTIEQVHFHGRHGSRNPTTGTYASLIQFGVGLKNATANLTLPTGSPFGFLKTWSPIFNASDVETLSAVGRAELQQLGSDIRSTYASLFPSERHFTWNANSQPRVLDSAYNFALGALGSSYNSSVTWNVLPETSAAGPGSLFGYSTCNAYNMSYLADEQKAWQANYVPTIVKRLNTLIPGYTGFTSSSVGPINTMCAYETAVAPASYLSPWCSVYEPSEILNLEWDNDINYLQYSYTNPNAIDLGGTYVQRVAENLRNGGKNGQGVYATFSHDNSLAPIITALGMYTQDGYTHPGAVPTSYNPYSRQYTSSHTVNFASNIAIELFSCSSKKYVRLQNNQAVYPLEDCGNGPSGAPDGLCELEAWLKTKAVKDSVKHGVENGAKLCNGGVENPGKVDMTWY